MVSYPGICYNGGGGANWVTDLGNGNGRARKEEQHRERDEDGH